MDNKLSVKFESGLYEQTYKFRMQNGLENMEDIRQLVDIDYIQSVEEILMKMHQKKVEAVGRKLRSNGAAEFEEII